MAYTIVRPPSLVGTLSLAWDVLHVNRRMHLRAVDLKTFFSAVQMAEVQSRE